VKEFIPRKARKEQDTQKAKRKGTS